MATGVGGRQPVANDSAIVATVTMRMDWTFGKNARMRPCYESPGAQGYPTEGWTSDPC